MGSTCARFYLFQSSRMVPSSLGRWGLLGHSLQRRCWWCEYRPVARIFWSIRQTLMACQYHNPVSRVSPHSLRSPMPSNPQFSATRSPLSSHRRNNHNPVGREYCFHRRPLSENRLWSRPRWNLCARKYAVVRWAWQRPATRLSPWRDCFSWRPGLGFRLLARQNGPRTCQSGILCLSSGAHRVRPTQY